MKTRFFETHSPYLKKKKFHFLKGIKNIFWELKDQYLKKTCFFEQVLDFHRHSTSPYCVVYLHICLLLYASNRFHILQVGLPAISCKLQNLYYQYSISWAMGNARLTVKTKSGELNWCQNADAGRKQLTNSKNGDTRLTFFSSILAFRHLLCRHTVLHF